MCSLLPLASVSLLFPVPLLSAQEHGQEADAFHALPISSSYFQLRSVPGQRTRVYSHSTNWSVHEYMPEVARFRSLHTSPKSYDVNKTHLADIKIADFSGDGQDELGVLFRSGELEIRDIDNLELIGTRSDLLGDDFKASRMHAIDLVPGGGSELVLLQTGGSSALSNRLRFLDHNGDLLREFITNGYYFWIGQLDRDPGLELMINDGMLIDLASMSVQGHVAGVTRNVVLLDVDADGVSEVLSEDDGELVALDAISGEVKWEYSSGSRDLTGLGLVDLNSDGVPEVKYVDYQRKAVVVIEVSTSSVVWECESLDAGFRYTDFADFDDDGLPELFYIGWQNHELVNVATSTRIWARAFSGIINTPAIGDLDGDGADELVFLGTPGLRDDVETGFGLVVLDARTMRYKGSQSFSFGSNSRDEYWQDLTLADPDGDGRMTVFIGGQIDAWTGVVQEWQYSQDGSFQLLWNSLAIEDLQPIARVRVGDLDGDGDSEVVAATSIGQAFTQRSISVFDYDSQSRVGSRKTLRETMCLELIDLNADGAMEVVAVQPDLALRGGAARVYSGSDLHEETIIPGFFTAVEIVRPPGLFRDALMFGDDEGRVSTYIASDRELVLWWSKLVVDEWIGGLTYTPDEKVLVSAGGRIHRWQPWLAEERGMTLQYFWSRDSWDNGRNICYNPARKSAIVASGGLLEFFF